MKWRMISRGLTASLLVAAGVIYYLNPHDAAQVPLATASAQTAPEPQIQPQPVVSSPSDCKVDLAVIPQKGAMLDLGLLAPCHPKGRVVIRHAGLVVTGQTSEAGTLIATLPALATPAKVTLVLPDGAEVGAEADVPDLGGIERFALQWMGGDDFELHAFEGGAAFGEAGHISAQSPATPQESGGFLTLLGDATGERALLAEVYTFPRTGAAPELSIEAGVTEASCDREILAETLHMKAGQITLNDLSIEMPACEAIGEFVVLPNPHLPPTLPAN